MRPSFALLTAAAAVATPAMFYHGYLMSEALAYPVFLVAVAVIAPRAPGLRAGSRSRYRRLRVGVATRVQFLVLPLAYLVGVAVCGRGHISSPRRSCSADGGGRPAARGLPGVLGQYGQARHRSVMHRARRARALMNGNLLTYGLGLAIVAGALFGLGLMLGGRAPRSSEPSQC